MGNHTPAINLKWKCDLCGKQGAREYYGRGVACESCALGYAQTWHATYNTTKGEQK
jgi:hypothetical protein